MKSSQSLLAFVTLALVSASAIDAKAPSHKPNSSSSSGDKECLKKGSTKEEACMRLSEGGMSNLEV